MKDRITVSDSQLARIENLKRGFLGDEKSPKVIVNIPPCSQPATGDLISSAGFMLKSLLENARNRLEVADDYIPQIRVEFGTGQVANAFGCEMYIPNNSPVCSKGPLRCSLAEMAGMETPSLSAGWFKKAYEFTEYFLDNKPDWVGMQLLDFQSPFNNAHLIRGNDIMVDFYDDPETLDWFLEKLTSYQVDLVKHYRNLLGIEDGYIYDWGIVWKGNARMSNCSLHMISIEFYHEFIKKHIARFISEVNSARIHYCGTHDGGIVASFCGMPGMTGLDLDGKYHDPWELSYVMPEDVPLLISPTKKQIDRILSGDIPKKRNLILFAYASCLEEAKVLYRELKSALS